MIEDVKFHTLKQDGQSAPKRGNHLGLPKRSNIMKKANIVLGIVVLTTVFCFVAENASAQLFRRQSRRAQPAARETPLNPPRRQGPLIRGDGRFLERAMNAVNLFTESGTELKPVAVVSLASFDEFKRVIQIVAREVRLDKGSSEEPAFLDRFLEIYESVVQRGGFDTKQPLGLILQTDGVLYYPLLFTPLDLDGQIGQSVLRNYAEQLPDGRYALRPEVFNWPLGRLFVRQHNGWLFVATETQLNALPDDPTVLLRGLDREHLFAARFDLQNIPKLSTRAALSLGEMNAVAKAETELEKAGIRLWIEYLRSLSEQSDILEYTVSYDEKNNDYVFRQREIVKPDTERAELLRRRREATSSFHGFYHPENAILASHFVMYLTQSQRDQLEIILDETIGKHLLTDEERREWKKPTRESDKRERRARRRPVSSDTASSDTATAASEIAPETTGSPAEKPVNNPDTAVRLAELLAMVPPEDLEIVYPEFEAEAAPDFALSELPEGELNDTQKLETVLRRIGTCYYWALVGSVRGGVFDGASTWSDDHGILAAYNIVEGERFEQAFDAVFSELEEKYPDVYAKHVQKDYGEYEGFRLSAISFRLADLVGKSPWSSVIPLPSEGEETVIILGVRQDAICFAVGRGKQPEIQICDAIAAMESRLPVYDLFFMFSAYELGQAFARSGNPERMVPFKMVAADTNPNARAYAVSEFTELSKTITVRVSGLLTPSLWRFRDTVRESR